MPKSRFLEALEIVTMSLGRWVSEVDVIIAKQTFRVVLYPVRRPRGKKFCIMVTGNALFLARATSLYKSLWRPLVG